MKIKLLGKNLDHIRNILESAGLKECGSETPEVVITYGGDGALLGAERDFPGILKLPLRDKETAPTCPQHETSSVISNFINGKLNISLLPKLSAQCHAGSLSGINDLVLHTADYTTALRYRVWIDNELYAPEVVGDGICFASVHGSTAYYRSITKGTFRTGVGLAFSNSTEAVDHLVLPETSTVSVEIIRGTGIVMADNDPRKFTVNVGDHISFCQTREFARICGLEDFMCQDCRYLRHRSPYFFSREKK